MRALLLVLTTYFLSQNAWTQSQQSPVYSGTQVDGPLCRKFEDSVFKIQEKQFELEDPQKNARNCLPADVNKLKTGAINEIDGMDRDDFNRAAQCLPLAQLLKLMANLERQKAVLNSVHSLGRQFLENLARAPKDIYARRLGDLKRTLESAQSSGNKLMVIESAVLDAGQDGLNRGWVGVKLPTLFEDDTKQEVLTSGFADPASLADIFIRYNELGGDKNFGEFLREVCTNGHPTPGTNQIEFCNQIRESRENRELAKTFLETHGQWDRATNKFNKSAQELKEHLAESQRQLRLFYESYNTGLGIKTGGSESIDDGGYRKILKTVNEYLRNENISQRNIDACKNDFPAGTACTNLTSVLADLQLIAEAAKRRLVTLPGANQSASQEFAGLRPEEDFPDDPIASSYQLIHRQLRSLEDSLTEAERKTQTLNDLDPSRITSVDQGFLKEKLAELAPPAGLERVQKTEFGVLEIAQKSIMKKLQCPEAITSADHFSMIDRDSSSIYKIPDTVTNKYDTCPGTGVPNKDALKAELKRIHNQKVELAMEYEGLVQEKATSDETNKARIYRMAAVMVENGGLCRMDEAFARSINPELERSLTADQARGIFAQKLQTCFRTAATKDGLTTKIQTLQERVASLKTIVDRIYSNQDGGSRPTYGQLEYVKRNLVAHTNQSCGTTEEEAFDGEAGTCSIGFSALGLSNSGSLKLISSTSGALALLNNSNVSTQEREVICQALKAQGNNSKPHWENYGIDRAVMDTLCSTGAALGGTVGRTSQARAANLAQLAKQEAAQKSREGKTYSLSGKKIIAKNPGGSGVRVETIAKGLLLGGIGGAISAFTQLARNNAMITAYKGQVANLERTRDTLLNFRQFNQVSGTRIIRTGSFDIVQNPRSPFTSSVFPRGQGVAFGNDAARLAAVTNPNVGQFISL